MCEIKIKLLENIYSQAYPFLLHCKFSDVFEVWTDSKNYKGEIWNLVMKINNTKIKQLIKNIHM